MAEIVGVVFRGGVKVYHFDPAGIDLSRGDRVVVQTMSGPEIGQVVERILGRRLRSECIRTGRIPKTATGR